MGWPAGIERNRLADDDRLFLAADLIDYLQITIVPIVLGRGELLWDGMEELEKRFGVESVTTKSGVTHLTFIARADGLGRTTLGQDYCFRGTGGLAVYARLARRAP